MNLLMTVLSSFLVILVLIIFRYRIQISSCKEYAYDAIRVSGSNDSVTRVNSRMSNSFGDNKAPFFSRRNCEDKMGWKKTDQPGIINILDTLYVAIHLAEAGERPTSVIKFIKDEYDKNGKLHQYYYWHSKKPASKAESIAVYGVAAQLCYLVNENKLAKELVYRVVCLQKFDVKPLFYGIKQVFHEPLQTTDVSDYIMVLHGSNRNDCPFCFVEKNILRHLDTSG